jgi:transcriptional regulator with XRE-family HTH domain
MFYEKLKKLCFERGISVSKMAVDLKISTTTVTGWKRGSKPQPAQVKKIVEYFNISTEELLYEAPAAAVSPTELQEGKSTDLMGLIISQQEAIRNLSESGKNLSETSRSFAKSTENLSESSKNLSESSKNLSESNKNLSEYLSKSAVHRNHR